jgi:hypothetical protein
MVLYGIIRYKTAPLFRNGKVPIDNHSAREAVATGTIWIAKED